MPHILFLCTGNYVRSRMAEAFLRREVAERGDKVTVSSAGTTDWGNGRRLSKIVLQFVSDYNGKPSRTSPHLVTAEEVAEADKIVVMDTSQVDFIRAEYPAFSERLFKLGFSDLPNIDHLDQVGLARIARDIDSLIRERYNEIICCKQELDN